MGTRGAGEGAGRTAAGPGRALPLPGRAGHDAASAPPPRRPGKPRAAPARKGDLGAVTASRGAVGTAGRKRAGAGHAGRAALAVIARVACPCRADREPRVLGEGPRRADREPRVLWEGPPPPGPRAGFTCGGFRRRLPALPRKVGAQGPGSSVVKAAG